MPLSDGHMRLGIGDVVRHLIDEVLEIGIARRIQKAARIGIRS